MSELEVNRREGRLLGEAKALLRPGDELRWIDGVLYRGMSDGTLAVFGDHTGRRRRRPRFYWAKDLAAEREEWERNRVEAEVARLEEMADCT